MIYQGDTVSVTMLEDGIAELKFDNANESVNKFDEATLADFNNCIDALTGNTDVKGIIVTSGKGVFIAGADITEFGEKFANGIDFIQAWLIDTNAIFNRFEDLPVPKVAAINGVALGGGFEMCLVCDFRVMASSAKVGLPETKLGIFPGFGGSVRLPRLIGIDNALEWIATGKDHRADAALAVGAVDAVVSDDNLKASAIDLVKKCIAGELDWQARVEEKLNPVLLNQMEQTMAISSAKGQILAKARPSQYPAPSLAIEAIEKHINLPRDEAIKVEAYAFAKAAITPQASALVGLFLNDQTVKKLAKKHSQKAHDINEAAVLGAGIMGGGIAYQAVSKGLTIIMKDIKAEQLDLGMGEASKILGKAVKRKKITPAQMGETLSRIRPTLNYGDFGETDIVIEAVVENPKVKHAVLKEVESLVKEDAIIASNTSTISITHLATALERPENFVGMHFFNPVHRMPLVEVIRGEKSSEEAIATTVALASKMGKVPVVVNDCPGFLVNRVLFPYFGAFDLLIKQGADFVHVDKVMEKFGWPMGPAYLIDVVGLDTGVHGAKIMADGFPDRMKPDFKGGIERLFEENRLGQKNGVGFYKHETDKRGKPKKVADDVTYELLKDTTDSDTQEFDDQTIIDRMMLAFCNETVRCLEDNIVSTPAEADMAMIMGVGFPPFRGGPCRYIDQIGLDNYLALCEKYADLGKAYQAPQKIRDMAANNETFY